METPKRVTNQDEPEPIWCTDSSSTMIGGYCSRSGTYFSVPVLSRLAKLHSNVLEWIAVDGPHSGHWHQYSLDVTTAPKSRGLRMEVHQTLQTLLSSTRFVDR